MSARLLIEGKAEAPLLLSALHLLVGLFGKTDFKGGLQNLEHLRTFLKDNGTLLEEDCKCVDPFSEDKKKSKVKPKKPTPILCTHKCQSKQSFKVQDLIILSKVDEKELILLVNEGPVAVVIDFYKEFENFEGDGFYDGPPKGSKRIDKHMLLITGYATYKKQHYWKCQNSAGRQWGDNGNIKILRQLLNREAYNP
ncbi:PREDICTED: cathepsin 7-like [Camelina sativa]|uniref:Cathepsin 7-like n=1 Tax=Camelina sativa TaxID=90675 RepID=A0ABM0WQ71_CAMSA|nr:PREDICTED: cathepsin 7-like [Camelina sativa]